MSYTLDLGAIERSTSYDIEVDVSSFRVILGERDGAMQVSAYEVVAETCNQSFSKLGDKELDR